MNFIINKIINSKISWIILGSIFCFLVVFLVLVKPKDNNLNNPNQEEVLNEVTYFDLKGADFISLFVNEEYNELGYTAYNQKFEDISFLVNVNGKVDTSNKGIYTLEYVLNYNGKIQVLTRTIEVLERDYNDINFKLNGDNIVYVPINSVYQELGATAYLGDYDITDEISISSNLDITKIGIYEVVYNISKNDIIKEFKREVVVFDIEDFFEISNTKTTNKDIVVDVIVNDYFRYVILPDKTVKEENIFSYNISSNGVYEFTLYDIDGNHYKKSINVSNIDKESPRGSCLATLYNDRVEVVTNINDNSKITSYRYMLNNNINELSNSNAYVTKSIKKVEKAVVEVVDSALNSSKINCSIKDERGPVFIDGNHCSDEKIYAGTKYSLTDKQKKKLAAMVQAEYGGGLLGMKAAASHMANLYEYKKWKGATSKSFYDYISTTTWYAGRTRRATKYNENSLKAVEDCIVNGNRILPHYIDELDWFPYDIKSYKKPSYYVPGETKISNKYGADGIFWCFTIYSNGEGNVFFYSSSSYKNYIESKEQ